MKKQETTQRIIKAAIDVVAAEHEFREARAEVKNQFDVYFRAYGRPEGQFFPYNDE